jgi:L-fucose mutarotase
MLTGPLLHPEILAALGTAGHGSRILVADGNFPFATRGNPAARRVYLNLAPGLVGVPDVLRVLVETVPIEAAAVMISEQGSHLPIHAELEAALPAGTPLERLDRYAFYDAVDGRDLALIVATGELRTYANVLLTIGVRTR